MTTSAVLQIKVNGGAPQTGGVICNTGDVCQLTAADKTGWSAGAAQWQIYAYAPSFSLPSGWTLGTDDAEMPFYYYLGNSDPPPFTVNPWGKYKTRLIFVGKTTIIDNATMVQAYSPVNGLRRGVRGEGAQFGGLKQQWVADYNANLDIIEAGLGGGGGGSGLANVLNRSALLALDAIPLQSGAEVYVRTFRRKFVLDKVTSGLSSDPGAIEAASGGGWWVSSTPNPACVAEPLYFLSDAGSIEANGITSGTPIPYAEWVRRTSQPWPYAYSPVMKLVGDCAIYRYDATWAGASNNCFPRFYADPKTKILNNVTVTAVTLPDPCVFAATSIVFNAGAKTATQASGDFTTKLKVGQKVRFEGSALNTSDYLISSVSALIVTMSTATIANETISTPIAGVGGTEGTLTIAGSFTSSVGKIGIINAGPRAGALFQIIEDKGGGVARIGNVDASIFDDTTPVALAPSDTFDTWDFVQCTTDYQQNGPFDQGGANFSFIAFAGDVNFGDATVGALGACTVAGEVSIYSGAQVTVSGCVTHNIELYGAGLVYLFGGVCFGAIQPSLDSTIGFRNHTLHGASSYVIFNDISRSSSFIGVADNGWLACFDLTNPIVSIPTLCAFVCGPGSHIWGQNCTGPRLVINPGGQFSFDVTKPSLTGSGHDYSLVGVSLDANQVPASNVGSAAWIYERSTGGPNTSGGVALSTTAPADVGTTDAVGTGTTAARSDHVHAHAAQTDGTLHAAVIAAGASGFMTGADKTKLDSMTSGAAVASVAVNAPITNSGSSTALSLHVTAADATHDGYLAQADYSLLHTATAAATNSALCQRDSSGTCAFTSVTSPVLKTASGALAINAFTGVENHQVNGTTVRVDTLSVAGANTIVWQAGIASLTDSIAQATSGAGVLRSTYGQQGFAGSIGGIYKIGGGAGGTPGTNLAGDTQIDLGASISASISAKASFLVGGASVLDIGNAAPSWLGGTGTNIAITAQGNIASVWSTGHMIVRANAGFQLWLAGDTTIFYDNALTARRTIVAAASFTDTIAATCTSATVSIADTSGNTGAPFADHAQNATGVASTGGARTVRGGTGNNQGGAAGLAGGAGGAGTGNGGDAFVCGGVLGGSGKQGNVNLCAESSTANAMGGGIFVGTVTTVPTAAPASGVYCYAASSGVLRAVDSGSTGNRAEDLHASFKADQTVAFVPTAVAKFRRSGSGKFTSAVTRTIVQIEAGAIPSGGSIVSVGRLTIKVIAFDSTAGGVYSAIWQSAYKSIAGTLSVETAVLVGTAIDNTSTDVTGITTVLNSGAIDVKFVTLKTDPIYVLIEVEVDGMRIS